MEARPRQLVMMAVLAAWESVCAARSRRWATGQANAEWDFVVAMDGSAFGELSGMGEKEEAGAGS